jgi:hypothetical protein
MEGTPFGSLLVCPLLRRATRRARCLKAEPSDTDRSLLSLSLDVVNTLHLQKPLVLPELKEVYEQILTKEKFHSCSRCDTPPVQTSSHFCQFLSLVLPCSPYFSLRFPTYPYVLFAILCRIAAECARLCPD